jgi:bifunctional DNase/RNase
MPAPKLIDVNLIRIVVRDGEDRQYIFLAEVEGERGFPIVIGNNEAGEIQRVVHQIEPERPLTHQLTYSAIGALGGRIEAVEIVDLKQNTFYARMLLGTAANGTVAVDARPSDAIALALRAKCPIRVTEEVLAKASDTKGPS